MAKGFTDEQVGALNAPLAREHIKTRDQARRQVSYLEGWHVISEANRIFGFDGWDRETEIRCVTERETKVGERQAEGWRVAYIGKVRLTVRAGDNVVVREGTGYGSGIDVDLGAAHESAAKECETDCLKRSLMTFGNPFGLALYDKAQAGVEPPQRPASAPHPPRPPNRHAPSDYDLYGAGGSTETAQIRMAARRDKILAELQTKETRAQIESYKKLRQDEIDRISAFSPQTGSMLEGLFMTMLENAAP